MSIADDEQLQTAIKQLEKLIQLRVQHEQRRDQLTGLRNDRALREEISARLEESQFWIAFVEVDRFKSINDRFGYENADRLLVEIAQVLQGMSRCFPLDTEAFRAHGDEFYLLGGMPVGTPYAADTVHDTLDRARRSVEAVRYEIPMREAMSCTVSVGWLHSGDTKVSAPQELLTCLECAVAEAKHLGRNRVERFSPMLVAKSLVSLRAECSDCRAKFSLDLPREANRRDSPLRCPNCGAEIRRPTEPLESPATNAPIDVAAVATSSSP